MRGILQVGRNPHSKLPNLTDRVSGLFPSRAVFKEDPWKGIRLDSLCLPLSLSLHKPSSLALSPPHVVYCFTPY